jgi:hypothetical protein
MIDDRRIHRAQNSIGYICGTGNLQKVAACMNHFNST